MAVLEKIRVKMGAFITILIAIALLSFIIDPSTLESTLSMFSSKYDVGEIDGKSVTYQDYQNKVDYFTGIYEMSSGGAMNDQTQELINNTAWQDEITERVFIPAAMNAGLNLGEEELLDMSQGNDISPVLANEASFRDENGAFDRHRVVEFVQAVSQDPSGQLQLYWNYLEDNMRKDRLFTKYISLLEKSAVVNPMELARAIADNNTTYSVDFVVKPMGFAQDSTVTVSNEEIRAYYEEHKHNYKQPESKDIDYVVYEVVPSAEDLELTYDNMEKVYPEFTTTSNMKTFLARNSDQPFTGYYYSEEELGMLPSQIAEFATEAKVSESLPVFQDENVYYAARLMDVKSLPDSIFVKHILLPASDEAKADSLLNVLKRGGDFVALASEYSLDQNPNVEEPGDLGWMTQRYIIPGFEQLFMADRNEVVKLTTSYGIHLVKFTQRTAPYKKYQVALLVKEAVAGKQTYADYYAKANDFATQCGGDAAKFDEVAKALNVPVYPALRVLASAKTISNSYDNTKEVLRWMNESETGDVSEILAVDNRYFFIVAIRGEHHAGIATYEEMASQLKDIIMYEKESAKLAAETEELVAGAATLEQVAEKLSLPVSHRDGVVFSSLTSQQLDPKFIGAIASANEGELVGPVIGEIGVYYFTVTGKEIGAFYTEDDAKNRKARELEYMTQVLPAVLAEQANVVDTRYKFY